jgi:2-haloacid dehalogenase
VNAVVFDLGGVLVDWDPRYLYRKVLAGRDEEMEAFLADVCNQEWNVQQDAGRTIAEATAAALREHPEARELILVYFERWAEQLGGAHEDTVAILEELDARGVPLYSITNWAAETFHHARVRFPWLSRFRDIVVSGEIGIVKPDPRIFRHLMERNELRPAELFFTDDHEPNVVAAAELGMAAHLFRDAAGLRRELVSRGLLEA